MKHLLVALAMSGSMCVAAAVSADSWPGARPQVYTSAAGGHRFKTRPPQLATWSARSSGTLVTVSPTGSETEVWSRELVNIPVLAYISDDGAFVVTLDTWAKLGYEHALVVYDGSGAVVADHPLEALLSANDIASHVARTVNARRWLQGATIGFDSSGRNVVIRLHWGKVVRVALPTGEVL